MYWGNRGRNIFLRGVGPIPFGERKGKEGPVYPNYLCKGRRKKEVNLVGGKKGQNPEKKKQCPTLLVQSTHWKSGGKKGVSEKRGRKPTSHKQRGKKRGISLKGHKPTK